MVTLNWQEPPASNGVGGWRMERAREIDETVAALRANPGRWALVAESISLGANRAWRKRGCQVRMVCAGRPKGKCALYVRWPLAIVTSATG